MAATVTITIGGVLMKLLRADYLRITSFHPEIFELLLSMCITQGQKSPSGSRYCFPKQEWIATESGTCRKTANEAVAYHNDNGHLRKQQRAPRRGKWRSCLYFPGPVILKAIACAMATSQALLKSVTEGLHISLVKHISPEATAKTSEISHNNKSPGLSEIINRVGRTLGYE